jgi:hypothetical protein
MQYSGVQFIYQALKAYPVVCVAPPYPEALVVRPVPKTGKSQRLSGNKQYIERYL